MRLAEYGYEPVFVFSKHGALVDDLNDRGYRVVQIKRAGLLRVATIREAFALIRELGISLVHVNSAVPFSKYMALAGRLAGVPVVWHIREPVEDKRMDRQRRWIRRLANRIVVLTRQQASFFNAPDKTTRVFNGVDLVRFRRQTERGEAKHTLGYAGDEFLFIQIGSIEHNKGQYRAVQALAQLLAELPHCRLLIVGAVLEPEELNAVEAFVATNPSLKAAVRLYGETADVRPLIWAADCLLLPSLRESFPRTIMESMAAGTPVIASAVGAVEDMVDNGVTGLLVPPDDAGALATAMRAMATTDLAVANSMAANCERAAAQSFSMEAHMAAVTSIYDQLLAPH
jgi:glycosyltransferase involved in cell wall biosynthesis